MSFQGRIEDVAVTDVMQLIRLGGHSGTLSIHAGEEEALIGFERGRLVSAWSPRSLRLGEMLLAAGCHRRPRLAAGAGGARERAASAHHRAGSGPARLPPRRMSSDRWWGKRSNVWSRRCWPGRQAPSTSRSTISTPLVEVSRFSGAPKVDMDTQQVILEVLQAMEEDSTRAACHPPTPIEVLPEGSEPVQEFVQVLTKGSRKKPEADANASANTSAVPEPTETDTAITIKNEVCERPRFQMVSPDVELLAQINHLLAETGDRMSAVGLRDAGASLLGEAAAHRGGGPALPDPRGGHPHRALPGATAGLGHRALRGAGPFARAVPGGRAVHHLGGARNGGRLCAERGTAAQVPFQ